MLALVSTAVGAFIAGVLTEMYFVRGDINRARHSIQTLRLALTYIAQRRASPDADAFAAAILAGRVDILTERYGEFDGWRTRRMIDEALCNEEDHQ